MKTTATYKVLVGGIAVSPSLTRAQAETLRAELMRNNPDRDIVIFCVTF